MSLKLGGSTTASTSDTSSNSNSAFNSTTMPVVPDWASQLTQNVAGQVGDLTQTNPQSLVAPAQPLQNQAAANATNLTGLPWNYDTAAGMTESAGDTSWLTPYLDANAPIASGGKASQWVNNYMDPYLQQVVGATSADLDASDANVRAQQALQLAGSGAFGGSGAAIAQSMTEGELARARATSIGQLESQGYQTALNAASGDADRATQARIADAQMQMQMQQQQAQTGLAAQQQQLQAANQLVGLSNDYDANQRANIATQDQVGDDLRNVDQQQLSAPVTTTQQIVAMLSGLPIQLFTGQTQQGTSSTNSNSNSSTNGVSATAGFNASFPPS